jgi:hypothetical protein
MKPQADISLRTFLLLQDRHSGLALPMIRHSKSWPQVSQWYS